MGKFSENEKKGIRALIDYHKKTKETSALKEIFIGVSLTTLEDMLEKIEELEEKLKRPAD